MKISSKGVYGLIALIDICINSPEGPVKVASIAQRQELPPKYLEQILPLLKKSNIVKSMLGAYGGYALAKDAGEITLKEILQSLEGDLSVVSEGHSGNMADACLKKYVWDVVDSQLNTLLEQMTLQYIVDKYWEENDKTNLMYYI